MEGTVHVYKSTYSTCSTPGPAPPVDGVVKIWNWTHSLYNVLHDRPHIIKGMRPVPYLLKVAFPEVALIFKVIPLNETKNFVRGSFFVGLHLLAGHRFEVRRFVKECVRANLCGAPKSVFERGLHVFFHHRFLHAVGT